jgi:phospholipid/cholesterol/gamma-HCH transport system permease protein
MTPVMTMVFNGVGLVGAYFVTVKVKGVDPGAVLNSFSYYTDPTDYLIGALKALVFGVSYALVACYRGLDVRGGATELGRATTRAVVEGAVSILIFDYFLTDLSLVVWPPRRY